VNFENIEYLTTDDIPIRIRITTDQRERQRLNIYPVDRTNMFEVILNIMENENENENENERNMIVSSDVNLQCLCKLSNIIYAYFD